MLPPAGTANYRLIGSFYGRTALEAFGPAGQRSVLHLPQLKTVTWISDTGRITSLNFR